jgi:ribonuclease E
VIKRRQIMLVQVEREPRGDQGAFLTTYLSLSGQYVVLIPNYAVHGISSEIAPVEERNRLVEIMQRLDVPEGMGVFLRGESASRIEAEIANDLAQLMQHWETLRDLTLKSTAPTLVYDPAEPPVVAPRDEGGNEPSPV